MNEGTAGRALASRFVGSVAWATAAAALAAPPAALDGPRPAGHVVDTVGLLAAEDVATIERLAEGIEAASGGDLVVVVIGSTAGQPHRAFATELFNRWQLGSADRDDGLLIFVATDDRKAEIVLGDGVDDPRQQRASQRIMDEVLIPEFRAGRPATGLRRAALACGSEILSAGPEAAIPDQPPEPEPAAEPFVPEAAELAPVWGPRPEPGPGGVLPLVAWGGAATGGTGLAWYLVRRRRRNRPRTCPACRIDMIRLGEQADDAELRAGQRKEEQLRSVDYDVWSCPTCPQVTRQRYGAFFTSYSRCPACSFVTESNTVDRVRSPTRWQTGLETITERCLHCGRSETSSRVIPQLSDDGGSSIGSSSSWSGGGSSGGGGGGTSSGGGASGSW